MLTLPPEMPAGNSAVSQATPLPCIKVTQGLLLGIASTEMGDLTHSNGFRIIIERQLIVVVLVMDPQGESVSTAPTTAGIHTNTAELHDAGFPLN